MPHRASLRECFTIAIDRMIRSLQEECSILRCERGKYYILIFPDEYESYQEKVKEQNLQLVLCMRLPELQSLLRSEQIDLLQQPPKPDSEVPN